MVEGRTEAKSAGAEPGSQRESREGKREAESGWSLVDTNHFLGMCPFSYFAGGYLFFGYPYTGCRATFMSDKCQANVRRMSDKRELTAK